jgi:hypothetical protein
VLGRELRRTDKELIGLAAASCGARGFCRLDHPEHGGVLRGYRFDVAQRVLGILSLREWILSRRTQLSGVRRPPLLLGEVSPDRDARQPGLTRPKAVRTLRRPCVGP